jgi:hypothetical protein
MKTRLLFTGYKVQKTVLGWTSLQKKQGRMPKGISTLLFFSFAILWCFLRQFPFVFFSIESKKLKAKKTNPLPIILARLRVVPHTANRPLPSGLSLAGGGLHSQRLRFLHSCLIPSRAENRKKLTPFGCLPILRMRCRIILRFIYSLFGITSAESGGRKSLPSLWKGSGGFFSTYKV